MDNTQQASRPAEFDNPETGAFWRAAAEEKLLLKICGDCNEAHWYPRHLCPHCGSDRTVWNESPGTGVIYSFSPMRRAKPVYVPAYVTLDEGVTIFTNIFDCDPDQLRIGQRVTLRFTPGPGGLTLPVFTPIL